MWPRDVNTRQAFRKRVAIDRKTCDLGFIATPQCKLARSCPVRLATKYITCAFLPIKTAGLIIDSLETLYQMNMFSHILSNNVLCAVTWIHLDTKMLQRYSDKSAAQKVFTKAFIRALIYRMQPFKSHSLVVNLTYSPAIYPWKTATVLGVTYLINQQFNWSFLSYFPWFPRPL